MKYIAFVLLSTILFILSCSSKTTIQTLDRKFDKKSYRLPSEIEGLEKSAEPWQYEAYGMLYYTWIGDYKKALELEQLYPTTYDDLTEEEISHFKTFKPVDAKEYILKRSKKERIIMINENHHSSINRTFATSLLQGLFDNGYKLLCIESLAHNDLHINSRRYPTKDTHFYTLDPQFGNLLREAMEIGFTLLPYESQNHENDKEREFNQAKNIEDIIEKYPTEKILVYCGGDHLMEGGEFKSHGKLMANHLKTNTGIDPFTISQRIFVEKISKEKSNPYMNLTSISNPKIFVNEKEETFHGSISNPYYDVELMHPFSIYKNGRPTWLVGYTNKKWTPIPKKKIKIEYPVLVKVFMHNESKNAIPVDIVHLVNQEDKKELCLKKGNYRLLIANKENLSQELEIKVK